MNTPYALLLQISYKEPVNYNVIRYTGHAVAQWLRHCATNRKVMGSIPDGVIGIFR
jgi:hypothetical protein